MHFFRRGVTLSTVDWSKIWPQWTHSVGARKIDNQLMISDLIALMDHCLATCKDSVVTIMGVRVKECMNKEGISKWIILETACEQLRAHRQVWETHLDQPDNLTVEFPIVIAKADTAKYFKLQIAQGNKLLQQPKSIRHIAIDYHEPTNTIKVTYV